MNGQTTLWVTKYSPLSTIDRSIIDASIPDYAIVGRVDTRTVRLADILDEHARERDIHFLKIDVEGHEADGSRVALTSARHRPIVLVIEATSPATNAPTWPNMGKDGSGQRVQIPRFSTDLIDSMCATSASIYLPRLCYSANCLDGYRTFRESQLQALT